MLTDDTVIVASPHCFDALETISAGAAAGGGGTLLTTVRSSRSPGRTCKVGACLPVGVTKQNKVRPAASTEVK